MEDVETGMVAADVGEAAAEVALATCIDVDVGKSGKVSLHCRLSELGEGGASERVVSCREAKEAKETEVDAGALARDEGANDGEDRVEECACDREKERLLVLAPYELMDSSSAVEAKDEERRDAFE